jgi:ubiquitin carboxyl-terminal hydrolase MINDY-1/2
MSEFTPSPPPVSSSLERTIGIDQPTSIPVSTEVAEDVSMRPLQSTLLDDLTGPAEDRAIKGENVKSGVVADLEKELPTIPQADTFPSAGSQILASLRPLVPNQGAAAFQYSTSQQPHLQGHSPSKATRLNPSLSTTVEAEIARLKEQRNETYQIKHFNWFDHNSRTLRRSSMLTQNKNGPCPLLALVNALILGVENDSRSALGAVLRTREQVSLGLIIESLIDELTSEGRCEELTELPDVDELNRFLLMLHTGMTANPRLAASASPSPNLMDARNSSLHLPLSLNNDRKPGTFETTRDMRLYRAFAIPLVHGWLAPRSDPARAAFARSAQTYEDAQTIQFGEEELEDKLSRVGLNPAEQQLLQDITFIKSFLESYPTQITPYGLGVINESLFPGAFAILFRNDHFSTIYKHPESGQLFTLVTDAGYSDKDEVIWESLVDVSGQNSEFFSGDFRPVGNADATNEAQQTQRNNSSERDTSQRLNQFHEIASAASPQEQQQQADADFAMALQLQEEEQARMDDSGRHLGGNDTVQNRNPGVNNSQSTRERDGSRPTIPTRNARYQGATRPVNPSSDEAPPPAYEEAAKGKPYLPPVGHPQHPSFDGRSPDSGPSAPVHPPGPRLGQAPRSRMSASQEWQFHSNSPLTPPRTNNAIGVPQNSARVRDKDKECTVM